MLTNLLIFYLTLVVLSFCIRLIFWDPRFWPKTETPDTSASATTPDKHETKDAGWKVQMRKPKREIAVVGCDTEGEVVREIILMGYRIDEIKDIVRL
jgi:hypothetical protein